MSQVLEALKVLKENKIINLTHDVEPSIPHFPIFQPIAYKTLATIDDGGFLAQEITIGSQYGTHIDAPYHFAKGKRKLNEIDIEERILPIYVLHFEDEVAKDPNFSVTEEVITAYEAEHGQIEAGDFVAISTGWSKRFADPVAFNNVDDAGVSCTPGWSMSGLKYLASKNVTAIGHETINTDSGKEYAKAGFLDCELFWLEQDKYQVELLTNLDQVPTRGGIIVIAVPHIRDASGFTVEAFAVVPN
ncbi:cyclase family protein [Aerococcaceae bacterium DSM 111176]|nr:cyclase family protein [Aerococcaceae bacterium DSM 111176]